MLQPLRVDFEFVMPGYSTFKIVTYSRRAAKATHLVALCRGVSEGLSGSRCMTVRQGGLERGLTQFLIGGVFHQRGLVPMPNFTMKKYVRNENSCWS